MRTTNFIGHVKFKVNIVENVDMKADNNICEFSIIMAAGKERNK